MLERLGEVIRKATDKIANAIEPFSKEKFIRLLGSWIQKR